MLIQMLKKASRKTIVGLGATLALILISEIVLTITIPEWRKYFYNVLETKNAELFSSALIFFTTLMLSLGTAQGLKNWVGRLLSFKFREVGTKLIFKEWVKGSRSAKHAGQALTTAMQQATELYLDIGMEIVISVSIVVALIMTNMHNPIILISAASYTVIAVLVATLFNKPLMDRDMRWQKDEGYFRDGIVSVQGGENPHTFKEGLKAVTKSYLSYIKMAFYFTCFSRVKGQVATIVPYVLFGTAYLSGNISLGTFMANVSIFELIVVNSTIVLIMYPQLTKARASYKISTDFYKEVVRTNDRTL